MVRGSPCVLVLLAACAGAPPATEPTLHAAEPATQVPAPAPAPSPAPLAPLLDLPDDWSTCPRDVFVSGLERWVPAAGTRRLDERGQAVMSLALRQRDEPGVRAAVLLARMGDATAGELLLARLEERDARAGATAGCVVAAAALAEDPSARDAALRLEALATGPRAHPSLDVRVECAVASLANGRDGAIPFLMSLLREGTSAAGRADWNRLDPDDPHLWRLQDRAARALSRRAGVECTFVGSAPVAAREGEIARLASLMAQLPPPAPRKP